MGVLGQEALRLGHLSQRQRGQSRAVDMLRYILPTLLVQCIFFFLLLGRPLPTMLVWQHNGRDYAGTERRKREKEEEQVGVERKKERKKEKDCLKPAAETGHQYPRRNDSEGKSLNMGGERGVGGWVDERMDRSPMRVMAGWEGIESGIESESEAIGWK
ncbi:uncharacterized protein BJ171DRAFT_62974 [Polychytrium aggregatum]|uniref:uncharacterized protein n=1 Tax=Polychytrium aggregatum TaxID=110093 RepID=UPI0022FEFA5C|nr:uncharacterized protein BJ171DRAFT_62974 [Polychytrium aggregatum]KAI9205573.1 hypothetical protein BJ171DRAFT_62974 [Polychytrium aggregatum]